MIGLSVVALAGTLAAAEPVWPAVTKEMRPWAYNWWMGCAVDKAGLELQAKQFAEAGMGGYHVIPIYEAKEEKHPKVAFLSEEWTRLFNTADETARAQGLGVDSSMGCGWCFGGPWVSEENGGWHLTRVRDGEKPKKKGSRLLWEGKNAKGRRMALYAVPTAFKVKRAPASGAGLMIDPFSPAAMREHLKPFDDALNRPGAVPPRAFYHDSYEYYGASWTPALFEAFKAKRGYDLRDHLPAFAGAGGTEDEARRVRHDYRETLSDLILDTFTIWSDWCRKRGITTRNEAHGSPSNWLDFYALSDIPETEMFNKDRDILVSKFASSAAHVNGTRLVASESCTWINEHFNASLEEVKVFLDRLFLSGVNHMFYHGCCYSPADAAWPGWCFYASLEMNPRNPIWRDAPILNAWITRVQSLAQTSEPDEDVLVYWTLHDYWRNQRELSYGLSAPGKEGFMNTSFGNTARRLYAEGVSFDYVSDRQLAALAKEPKRKWNAIVIPDCETMPVETARSLATLAKKGYKVVFDGRRPQTVPGLKDVETRRAALAKALAEIPSEDIKTVVRREPFNEKTGLAYTRFRRGEDTLYYVVNMSDKATQGVFRPTAKTGGAWLLDPMGGAIKAIAVKDGAVELALEKGESMWVWCSPATGKVPVVPVSSVPSNVVKIDGPWTLTPVCGGPDMEKGWPRTMQTLASWSRNDDGTENPFCGTVCYRMTFTLDGADAAKRATLDLGRVCESARVRMNGIDAGARIMPPYRVEIPAGVLKAGENVLEVEVTNVGANRIRDLDKRKVEWKIFGDINIVGRNYRPFDASKWPLRDSGLFGPVSLTLTSCENEASTPRGLRAKLAAEVKSLVLGSGAVSGCVLAAGDGAVPLVFGREDGTDVPVAVAAQSGVGGGRVVATGHTAFFAREAVDDAENRLFLRECLIWLAGGKVPETIYLDVRQNPLRPLLERVLAGVRIEPVKAYGELEKLPASAVFITYPDSHPLADARFLSKFVERGGGAFCFSVGWGWHQVGGGKSFAGANPCNAALLPVGVVSSGRTVDANLPGRRFAVAGKDGLPGASAEEALRLVSDSAKPLPGEAFKRCSLVLGELTGVLPKDDKRWLPKLKQLATVSAAQPLPSPEHPLKADRFRERMGFLIYQNVWQSNPERNWPAHPAAAVYPGIPADGTPRVTREVDVDLDVPRWHGTGLFAVAGEPLTVTLPENAEKLGLRVRVGTTHCNVTGQREWMRAPLVTVELPLDKRATTFASPFGGLVYVTVPRKAKGKGRIRVKIGPACPSARFVEGRDTPESWRESLRTCPAPFAEIENDVIALTVPLETARTGSDPRELLALWRQILKNDAWLTGIPEKRDSPERMCFDVQLCMGYMHSGYPIMLPKHTIPYLLNIETMRKGEQDEVWGFFHEMGHNHQNYDWTFDGTGEVTVNFFSLYNMEKICGRMPRQTPQMGNQGVLRRVARWKAAGRPFDEWKRDPFLALDFFVELRMKYGWDAFKKLFDEYRTLPKSERPKNDLEKRQQWCRRFSRIVGEDLTNEFSFMLEGTR